MDGDVSMSLGHDYMSYFDVSPTNFPWRSPRPQEIEMRRAHMTDVLIFDILLSSGGIGHPDALYPPATPEALQDLLDAIANSTYDALKRDCLVYFLLKWHQDGREEEFKIRRCIPPQFSGLADAYWHLDSGIHIARAVSILSDSRITRDYTSKVLEALALAEEPHTLIRTYVRTAKPILTEPNDIDAFTIALAESSLTEAWTYQRSFSEASKTRSRLVNKILDWCLTPKPRPTSLTHLLALPFSPYEQSLVHDYALEPPEHLPVSSIPVIQDLVCVRLVQGGQHAEAIKLDRQFSSVPRGGEKGLKAAHDRRQILDELKSAMPASERLLLELELEEFSQGRGMANGKGKGRASDISMSWEQIRPPSTSGVVRTSAVSGIPQRSGAPRFGGPTRTPPEHDVEELFPSISHGARPSGSIPTSTSGAQIPKPPSHEQFLFGGITSQSPSSTNGWVPKSTNGSTANSQRLFGGISNGRQSLFETSGSANAAPNAFYQPPSSSHTSLFGSASAKPAPVSAFAALAASLSSKGRKSGRKSGIGADTSGSGVDDLDVSMLSELSESDSARGGESSFAVSRALDDSADMSMDMDASFSVSVFGRGESTRRPAISGAMRIARTETEAHLPPGAFLPDDEHELAHHVEKRVTMDVPESPDIALDEDLQAVIDGTPAREETEKEKWERERARQRAATKLVKNARARHKAEPVPPSPVDSASPAIAPSLVANASEGEPELEEEVVVPEPEPKPVEDPAPSLSSARSSSVRSRGRGSASLKRSVPGGFMDDEDDDDTSADEQEEVQKTPPRTRLRIHTEDDEKDDQIAPLPTPARRQPPRKSRASGAATAAAAAATSPAAGRVRRSSRLSTVSSIGSSSPEPISPQKPSVGRATRKTKKVSLAPSVSATSVASKTGGTTTKTRKRKA